MYILKTSTYQILYKLKLYRTHAESLVSVQLEHVIVKSMQYIFSCYGPLNKEGIEASKCLVFLHDPTLMHLLSLPQYCLAKPGH